jgi:RimJ/RimL family protein N-acetyltransferase
MARKAERRSPGANESASENIGRHQTGADVKLTVREMKLSEVGLIINYFHQSSPEHLNTLGVDPTRLPDPVKWQERYVYEYSQPIEKRKAFLVIWDSDQGPIGFSTADKIVYGEEAYMHLHIVNPDQRQIGNGTKCVKESVKIYFETLNLQRLFCEPNAFNIAPNRTLQRAGFRYVKTHETVPGPLNYHQAVTRWVLERR